MRRTKKYKFKKIFILLPLIFILFLVSLYIWKTGVFNIKEIIINGDIQNIRGIESLADKNIFFLNKAREEEILEDRNFQVSKITIEKKYPHTILLKIEKRQQVLQIETAGNFYSLDINGVVLGKSSTKFDLPVLILTEEKKLKIGEKADIAEISYITKTISRLKEGSFAVGMISIEDGGQTMKIVLADETIIYSSPSRDAHKLVSSLQIITSRFRIEGKIINTIDFRYDKPIVTFL
ncbi:MAG: hypothetical protein UT63_C0001G0017 [Candidatus Gottesmanbacteria bacterium GW2011_GWC2_39_8]|uniref:POTRA domain-containing protein n=1 Tax=Candidatus Gottesmanbacteria bacterium GW2011_GWC2_39_8 TaxID=1618450 RepID=A0A0G0SIC1_9BACT|nr:MAG: hypothetical protein UT63_C0001G0017 [Candidatus Gottesmanbacteria bacterium GW2011_GWC2_39_8]